MASFCDDNHRRAFNRVRSIACLAYGDENVQSFSEETEFKLNLRVESVIIGVERTARGDHNFVIKFQRDQGRVIAFMHPADNIKVSQMKQLIEFDIEKANMVDAAEAAKMEEKPSTLRRLASTWSANKTALLVVGAIFAIAAIAAVWVFLLKTVARK